MPGLACSTPPARQEFTGMQQSFDSTTRLTLACKRILQEFPASVVFEAPVELVSGGEMSCEGDTSGRAVGRHRDPRV